MPNGEIVAFKPVILRNLKEIASAMGVGIETVRIWIAQGAPVAVENCGGRPRYSAELLTLQQWRVDRSRDSQE